MVEMSGWTKAAFNSQGNFQVTAQYPLLELPAQAHLQRFGAGRHAHVQIEESVVDAFDGQSPREEVADPAANPGKAGH
jgi:hypothetical protein